MSSLGGLLVAHFKLLFRSMLWELQAQRQRSHTSNEYLHEGIMNWGSVLPAYPSFVYLLRQKSLGYI